MQASLQQGRCIWERKTSQQCPDEFNAKNLTPEAHKAASFMVEDFSLRQIQDGQHPERSKPSFCEI
jgi:hypothetical protein